MRGHRLSVSRNCSGTAIFPGIPELMHRFLPRRSPASPQVFFPGLPANMVSSSSSRSSKKSPDGRFYNSAVVIDADGSLHQPYHKVHIPQDPGFFEKGYFYPGEEYRVFPTRYGRIAVLICYDQWFPEAARCVALEGAGIIFYPTAIGHPGPDEPAEGDWREAWELIQRSHAIANSVHIAAVNRVGREGGSVFSGVPLSAMPSGRSLPGQVPRKRSSQPRWIRR